MSAKKLTGLTDAELASRLTLKAAEVAKIRAEHAAVQKRFEAAYKAEEALREETDRRAVESGMSWDDLLYENGNASMVRYKACEAALAKLSSHGVMMSGYNPKTQQRVLMVALTKGDAELTERVLQSLLVLLPHVKEQYLIEESENPADLDGLGLKGVSYKYLSVLEKTCSEHGAYFLAINEAEERYEVRVTRYNRESLVSKQPSLQALLSYVAANLPYRSVEED